MAIVKRLKQHPPSPPSRYEVGIYCRVSTVSKTQVVSAGHQLSGLINDVANSHQARLYDVYLDVQSGRASDNRKNLRKCIFMRKAVMAWLSPMKKPVTRTVMISRKNARAG